MKLIVVTFFSFISLAIVAQRMDKQTMEALDAISQGYMRYGFEKLQQVSRTNDLTAQYYLAACYEHGIGTQQQLEEAFKFYRKAAERGLPDAMFRLSSLYMLGRGVSVDHNRSKEWYSRYEKKGGRLTLPDITEMHSQGLSSPQNYALSPASAYNTTNPPVNSNITTTNFSQSTKTDNFKDSQQSQNISPALIENLQIVSTDESLINNFKSDVDVNIPLTEISNENTFVLIIANENYQDVATVPYALNDGETFAKYCRNTLGIPEINLHFIKDATLNNIRKEINLISQIAQAYKGEASIIVYYAGHGTPDEATGETYILPIDGYGSDLSTCYSLNDIYERFGELPANKIVFFIDACFSGAIRGNGMLASARGIAIRAKRGNLSGNLVVISAAQGDETAFPYTEQKHGLFTYYLLKKLQETKGEINLADLSAYIHDNVYRCSLVVNGKQQTPSVNFSNAVADDWMKWGLK